MRFKVNATLPIKQCNTAEDHVDSKVYVTEQACWLKDHSEQVTFTTYEQRDEGTYLENGGGQTYDFATYCGVGWTIAVETDQGLEKVLKVLDPDATPADSLCPAQGDDDAENDSTGDTGVASVPKADVQKQIISAIEKAGGVATDVTCPRALPGKVGANMICRLQLNGHDQKVKVEVTRVEGGTAYFNVLPAD